MQATLVWFRQNLRLNDNPCLFSAADAGPVLPVYILDERNPGQWPLGAASRWWLHHSLQQLQQNLNGHLHLFSGNPLEIIPKLAAEFCISKIVWNHCYEPWQISRDKKLKERLQKEEVEVESFNGQLLWEPWQIHKSDGSPYRVFTPFYRNGCLRHTPPRMPLPQPEKLNFSPNDIRGNTLEQLNLLPRINWYKTIETTWQPGETGAAEKLSYFLTENLGNYREGRDTPSIEATSRLSPYLHFGEISPNQVWYAAHQAQQDRGVNRDALDSFLSELGWREFSYYLLYHFPDLPEKNFQAKFDGFPWRKDQSALSAWQRGRTGIPIVDAGMRELWQTGYMHNRVRMITGSFLVKNLLQHWRLGEDWFWDCLVDADLASNSASWQWVAGSGADAAPYFRIFNPVRQGQKFDPDGNYVKRYCPELAKLPAKYIHNPWDAPTEVLSSSDIELGKQYPHPIVDLKQTRQRALEAFSSIKQ